MNANRKITEIREEIAGKQVDIVFFGYKCCLCEEDKKAIAKSIKSGRKSGELGAIQNDRNSRIWTKWSIPFDKVKVGDTVEFSTSGRYNPGFHSTEKYIGVVERITWRGEYCVKTGRGIAIVGLKHIERVLKDGNEFSI